MVFRVRCQGLLTGSFLGKPPDNVLQCIKSGDIEVYGTLLEFFG